MRALALTTLLLVTALAAPSASALDLLPEPPVQLPALPVPVPTPQLPDLTLPVPTPVAPDLPPPVATPAPPRGGDPTPAPPASAPAPPAAVRSDSGASTPAATGRRRASAATPAPSARRSPGARERPGSRRAASRRTQTQPRRAAETGVAPSPTFTLPRPGATPAPRRQGARGPAARLADGVEDLVKAVPGQVLWALIGMTALALALAGNAFWQSRRRAALVTEHEALLDDVGVLSSALLPTMPEDRDGLSVSAAYRPADGPAAGGDFYDVFALDDQRLGVVLGDVSGHGRRSVRHAALARYTLRTLLAAGHAPGAALAQADALLARDLAPDFVTVIAAVYDRGSEQLTYAKAGHPPPIVLGTAHDPGSESPACPLGLGLGEDWPEYRVELTESVSVCLFTDGLEDARVDGRRLGRDEVERLLAAQDLPDAEQLLGDLRALADSVADDTAAVVLRREAAAAARRSP